MSRADEVPLKGGISTPGVARVGDTVRPLKPDSADFLWAFVHPAVYGEGEPAARMLEVAAGAYGWSGAGLVEPMLDVVKNFQLVVQGDDGAMEWGASELAYMERDAELFRARLGGEISPVAKATA